MGMQSERPSATALRTFLAMKKEVLRKMPSQSGSVYPASPSVCMWHTVTPFSLFCLPWLVIALTSSWGVAAAPWTKTVFPEKIICFLFSKIILYTFQKNIYAEKILQSQHNIMHGHKLIAKNDQVQKLVFFCSLIKIDAK
jgi:hypothetical protein